jgi:hypothetical protein
MGQTPHAGADQDTLKASPGKRMAIIARIAICVILVCLASTIPSLSSLNGYFLGDDFGVVQLLSSKSLFHILSLFTSPWTDSLYGELK